MRLGESDMSTKLDAVTGVVTISIAGITAALTPEDARQWGDILLTYSPLMLIGVLLLRLRAQDARIKQQDAKMAECESKHSELQNKLLLTYAALVRGANVQKLPSTAEFEAGGFNVDECIGGTCDAVPSNSDR